MAVNKANQHTLDARQREDEEVDDDYELNEKKRITKPTNFQLFRGIGVQQNREWVNNNKNSQPNTNRAGCCSVFFLLFEK